RSVRLNGHRRKLHADALLMLGDADGAVSVAMAALAEESFERDGIERRLAFAAIASGLEREAIDALLERVTAAGSGGQPAMFRPERIGLVRLMLTGLSDGGRADVLGVVAEAAERAAAGESRTLRHAWSIAAAFVSEASDAGATLRALLTSRVATPDAHAVAFAVRAAQVSGVSGGDLARSVREAVRSRPAVALGLLEVVGRDAEAIRVLRGDQDRFVAAAAMFVAGEIGNASDAIGEVVNPDRASAKAGRLRVAAEIHGVAGAWDAYDGVVGALEQLDSPSDLGAALIAGQRYSAASQAMAGAADAEGLFRASVGAGQLDLARSLAKRLFDADPFSPFAVRALLSVGRGGVSDAEATEIRGLLASLREIDPDSEVLAELAAEDLSQRGLHRAAVSRLVDLMVRSGRLGGLAAATEAAAARAASQPECGWITRRAASASSLAAMVPGDEAAVTSASLIHEAMDDDEAAFAVVEAALGGTSVSSLRRRAERLLVDLGREAEGVARRRERLGEAPGNVGYAIELAGMASRGSDPGEVLSALEAVPEACELSGAQRTAAASVVGRVAAMTVGEGDLASAVRDGFLGVAAWAVERSVVIPPAVHDRRIVLLIDGEEGIGRIAGAVEAARVQQPVLGAAFARRAGGLLVTGGRPGDGFPLLGEALLDPLTPFTTEAFEAWVRLVGTLGSVADAEPVLAQAAAFENGDEKLGTLARALADPYGDERAPRISEAAYLLALFASVNDREEEAEGFYRFTLELDPEHGWAANNLGYTLLEERGEVDASAPLIELAYTLLPDAASVKDSLAWLRYRQGVILDPAASDEAKPLTLGAVSLMERALAFAEAEDDLGDGTLSDHDGDALAAAGRTGDAVDAWEQAATLAAKAIEGFDADGAAESVRADTEAMLGRVQSKLRAVREGRVPPITPTPGAAWSMPAARDAY
ncbi:MAG: hypothetical protein AAF235_04485, partial [Planctomycetota bacterium]